MTAALATSAQVQALQAARRRAGIDDDAWRAKLNLVAGVTSTKALTVTQAAGLIDELRGRSGASARVAGPYGEKARALWISAYWLGIVDDRSDDALLAWVQRQTGKPSLAWVRTSADGVRVIEGLKEWLTREADVDWGSPLARGIPARAVLMAIFERLASQGVWEWARGAGRLQPIEDWAAKLPGGDKFGPMKDWSDRDYHQLIQIAGKWLRKVLAERAAEEETQKR